LNIGSDAPIAGVCIAGLVEVGVGEARGTVAAIPWRSTLTARRAPARAFRGGRAAPFNAGRPARAGAKISDQPYRFLNINPAFTIYVK
jgi:hypothetical protein